ncbi:methylated-DNA--[protein]-cysteine S-methyltransferase [Nocardioides caldifontis]|uniref:methylated-DNA--[protein]-cysteine S-methyltransferase n=1 Tax=Nocardioides caldifontis TaxID=2588938 RepID=UPI0011DF8F27|nr:methylated-DNA--[protein]-cysteine S-methyltransferase [Nocardioides caldifontis]
MWTTLPSPVGELRLVVHGGALTAVAFLGPMEGAPADPEDRATVERFAARADARPLGARGDDDPVLKDAAAQLTAYFDGALEVFDLPLAPDGTPFQQRVWAELRTLPYGTTASYGELAGRLGLTGHGARAVGLANGRNPLAIVVPCHRVLGAAGGLTGYGGGLARKEWLLAHEAVTLF